MKIKKCPDCVQLIHFDQQVGVTRCWNCGTMTDFSKQHSAEQKIGLWLDSRISSLLSPFYNLAFWKRWGHIALVIALPTSIVMLLICNSLQIRIVHDAAAPFLWR